MQALLDDHAWWRLRGGDGNNEMADDVEGDVHRDAFEFNPAPDLDVVAPAEFGLGLQPHVPLGGAQVHRAPGHRQEEAPRHMHDAPLKRGTGAWLRSCRAQPIHPGSPVTVLQAAYWLGTMKNENRVTDEVIDRLCGMIHKLLLPPGNLFPPSYHMVKAVLEVESSTACAKHICDKCWSVFPHLEHADYSACSDAECTRPGCCNKRFTVSDSGVVVPKRTMYQFDVRDTVLDLLDPVWADLDPYLRQREADFGDSATFWGSPAGQSIDKATGYKFSQPGPNEVAIPFGLGNFQHMTPSELVSIL